MRVPYFLLELGDTCIFQPQNIKPDNLQWDSIRIGQSTNRQVVYSSGEPELSGLQLFLNGRVDSYKSLIVDTKRMTIFKQIIDTHNRSLDV